MSQTTIEVPAVKENQISVALNSAQAVSTKLSLAVGLATSVAKRPAAAALLDSDDESAPSGKRLTQEADAVDNNGQISSIEPDCQFTAVEDNGVDTNDSMSQTIEHSIPDRLVGLMIGKGGESINRLQDESGARIQISTDNSGPQRQVTITGTQEQVDRARQLMDTIVSNAERSGGDGGSGGASSRDGGGGGGGGGGGQDSIILQVPAPKVGLLIGKAGETIKSLQDKAGVRMLLVQDSNTSALPEKPLKIIGSPDRLSYARELVMELLNSKDAREFPPGQRGGMGGGPGVMGGFDSRGMGGGRGGVGMGGGVVGMGGGGVGMGGGGVGMGGGMGGGSFGSFGDTYQEVKVPRRCVGVVIGKGGDMLRKINAETGAKVQFRQEGPADRELPERMLQVSGSNLAVQQAMERVQHLINAVLSGEIPVTDRPRGPESRTVNYAVPAEKAGLVIGKGGETVKEINRISGAYVAIQRDNPPNSSTKVFDVQGSPGQIAEAIRLICEKAGLPQQPQSAGFYGNGGGVGGAAGAGDSALAQETLPAPAFNSQTGQMDYSMAWAEYYRRQGMHEYADAILRQAGQQQPPQQQQDQQWQQWQQWQAWQNGGQGQQQAAVAAVAAAAAAGAGAAGAQQQQPGNQPGGQAQQQQAATAWAGGGWQQTGAGGAGAGGGAGGGWDPSGDVGQQAAAWGGPDAGGQQQQNWWYGNNSGR